MQGVKRKGNFRSWKVQTGELAEVDRYSVQPGFAFGYAEASGQRIADSQLNILGPRQKTNEAASEDLRYASGKLRQAPRLCSGRVSILRKV